MKDMKLSNIQKESEKIKIKKIINDCEDLKAQSLIKLGIMTFDKIRKGEIIDDEFDAICEEIKSMDIEIYTKYMQLRSFEKESKKITCQCGYVAFKDEKFCPQCGNSLIEEEKSYIICANCNQETERNSNFCACCGSKMKDVDVYNSDEVYCIDEDINIEEVIISDEIPEVDMIEEDYGKEFLKEQDVKIQEKNLEENEEENNDIIEEEFLEVEGRAFLKNHQNNTQE